MDYEEDIEEFEFEGSYEDGQKSTASPDPDGDWYTVSGAADYDAAVREGLGL